MKKHIKFLLLAPLFALSMPLFNSCGNNQDVFHIMTWNEEWKNFFKKYVSDEGVEQKSHWNDKDANGKYTYNVSASTFHFKGKVVKFTTVSNENSAYQMALDRVLRRNESLPKGEKVDMFLAESDYIKKYVDSDYTKDITDYGINMDNIYAYTKEAASDNEGRCKGVSFQCCPSGIIYRRSIAKQIFDGSDGTPEDVGPRIDSWDKFNAAAAIAKSKGYMMTGSFSCTYRIYSSGVTKPWVDDDYNLCWDDNIANWVKSTEDFINKGYTQSSGIWEDATTNEMYGDTGKTFCFDGPAWYYNFSMTNAQDEKRGCFGDWAIVQGPTPHFWGGTWLIAANGTDDDECVKDVMNQFINDEDVCKCLINVESQYINNKAINIESEAGHENAFLGKQNDIELFNTISPSIEFKHKTIFDQDFNEGLQRRLQEHYIKENNISLEKAIRNFYCDIKVKYPRVKIDTSYIPQ